MLNYKKKSADFRQRSQAHHKPNIQWFSLHLYGTNPIVYSFARFYFEVVIRERLSKLCKMSCIQLSECIANIVHANEIMQILFAIISNERNLYSGKSHLLKWWQLLLVSKSGVKLRNLTNSGRFFLLMVRIKETASTIGC